MNQVPSQILFGLYHDEEVLLQAVREARSRHLEIDDVYSPFPVHGLDNVLGLTESRLHVAGFIYGLIGALTGFLFMTWVFTRDWPIIFGGKPYFSAPSFIPITFEMTVLFASVGMVVTFYTICGMGPGVTNPTLDDRITDDKFCIAFTLGESGKEEEDNLRRLFKETGAEEVHVKNC